MKRLLTLAGLLVILLGTLPLQAQTTTATIYGRVVDQSAGVVPGAEVEVVNSRTGVTRTAITNEEGSFSMTLLPVGTYTITAKMTGFKTHSMSGVNFSAGQEMNMTLRLELGEVDQIITVSGGQPLLNTVSAQQNDISSELQIKELPTYRRNYTNLLANINGADINNGRMSINGLPSAGFTLTMDGTDATSDSEMPSFAAYQDYNLIKGVTLEAIEEVQVARNIFSAEVASTMSGNVNLITKTGTNDLHGSLFENYQSGGLNARAPLSPSRESLVFHQFGGSLGGPVVRNKLFFFGAYEGYRLTSQSLVQGNMPTQEFRATALAARPEYKPFFDRLPLPTTAYEPGDVVARYFGLEPATSSDNHFLIRGDYHITDSDLFNARIRRSRPERFSPRAVPENWRTWSGSMDGVSFAYLHSAARWSAETRYGYNSSDTTRLDGWFLTGVPALSYAGIGGAGSENFFKGGSVSSLDQVFSSTRGRHELKMGATYKRRYSRRENVETPQYSYSTADDFFSNTPSTAQFTFGVQPFELTQSETGFFVQDNFRVSPRLTVNAGLRYDYYSVPNEKDNRLFNRNGPFGEFLPPDQIYKADYNNFSPRFGFAYTLDDSRKTVLRGGYGIFVNPHPIFGGPIDLVLDGPDLPFRVRLARVDTIAYNIRYPMDNDAAAPIVRVPGALSSTTGVNPDFPNPYAQQWTLSVQRQLGSDTVFDIGYVGNRGVKLNMVRQMNLPDRQTGLRPVEGFSQFRWYDGSDSSNYNALQTALSKRFTNSLSFDANYTWSKNITHGGGDLLLESDPQDPSMLWLERGPAPNDLRHRFNTSIIYELMFPTGSRTLDFFVTGWQIGGIFRAQSGSAINITQSGSYPNSRPDFVGTTFEAAKLDNDEYYLNPDAFQIVPIVAASGAPERPGTLGRRAIRGPGFWSNDLSLAKNIHLGESKRLQLRADMFNSFNHTPWSGFTTNRSSSTFGRWTSRRGPRTVQLNLRFVF